MTEHHLLGEFEAARVAWNDVALLVNPARKYGPLPSYRTTEFLEANPGQRLAVLALLGHKQLLIPASALGEDYADGKFHRPHELAEFSELQRRRWPPTGDRALWVRYGPAGPPSTVMAPGVAA